MPLDACNMPLEQLKKYLQKGFVMFNVFEIELIQ